MKLLSHSNGIHKVDKEKISKSKLIKKWIIFILGLLILGFTIQIVTNFLDDTRLKSRFKYIRIDGNKMEYKFKSGGEYTVVLDGAIGTNMYQWNEISSSLEEKKISTFIYNRRGYGFNDGGDLRTPEEQAKDLKSLLKKAGAPEPYILVGEEYGSLIATNFVKLYPDMVSGIVLINPLNEETIKTNEFKNNIKSKYYRSKIESLGSNFSLTALLSKMGFTMENKIFMESLTESELDEFNSFKNNNKYRKAVSNEYEVLYSEKSNSQINGLFEKKPFYIITNDNDDSIKEIGNEEFETIYKVENNDTPFSIIDPNAIVNGVNSVIKDAKKIAKKS